MYLASTEKIQALLTPFLEEMHLALVDFSVRRQGQDFYIEIFVDHPHGGITIDECSILNRRLNEQMEKENIISENYILEVSSPGLDRPLRTREDFLRVINRHVHFYLSTMIKNKFEWTGVIKEVSDNSVVVDINSEDVVIPIQSINKALQVIA